MENQHKKITGYRDLTQQEIDLMNRIKAKGAEMLELHALLVATLKSRRETLEFTVSDDSAYTGQIVDDCRAELEVFNRAEPERWAAIGKTDIQTGIMALVRAVAKPTV